VGLTATVDDVIYMPSLNAPEDRPHPFVYFITILNQSEETVSIKGRKWILTQDSTGEKIVVEGDGVVSQFPVIAPGEDFSYNSYHVIDKDCTATGAFFGVTASGRVVYARIPEFHLQVPQWA